MRLIAHRGFAGVYPENTLRALASATDHADAVEIDVRRCGSGELVVIHDETVDRVTDGTGPVAEHTLGDLRSLDVLGTGEGVPTLEAALEAIPTGVGANLELKEAGTAADALDLARAADARITITSFSPAVLAAAREVDPRVPRALIVGDERGPAPSRAPSRDLGRAPSRDLGRAPSRDLGRALARARDLDCAHFHPRSDLCEETLVKEAHRAGMSVNAWTVRDDQTARRLAALGVDGLIADRWDVLAEADRTSSS